MATTEEDRNQEITAKEGDDVTLRCRLDSRVNLVKNTVEFKRDDFNQLVHVFRQRNDDYSDQMEQYRNRTTLNHEDLSRGVMMLQISSVNLPDSGSYECFVPKLDASCFFDVTVERRSNQDETKRDPFSTTTPPLGQVIKPGVPDGENRNNAVPAGIISTVVAIFFILFLLKVVQVLRKMYAKKKNQQSRIDIFGEEEDEDLEGGLAEISL